jgi:hypothetical protein
MLTFGGEGGRTKDSIWRSNLEILEIKSSVDFLHARRISSRGKSNARSRGLDLLSVLRKDPKNV